MAKQRDGLMRRMAKQRNRWLSKEFSGKVERWMARRRDVLMAK